jgi:hypothetical protein
VIEQKTTDLARFLVSGFGNVDFTEPSTSLSGVDQRELRRRILEVAQFEAQQVGIGKSMVHYLKEHAQDSKLFKIHSGTLGKLERLKARCWGQEKLVNTMARRTWCVI